MQLEKKVFCHWDLVRFISEEHLKDDDGVFQTLSVVDEKVELMIFLGRDDSNDGYEVRVYKNEPSDEYVPNNQDDLRNYEQNNEYATFYFDKYEQAHSFVDNLAYLHPEYKTRPIREIE